MIYPIHTIVAGVANLYGPDPVLADAVSLAARRGARLHLVHAFELPDLTWDAYARIGMANGDHIQRYAEDLRSRLEARARAQSASVDVHCHAVAGPSAPTILEVAREQGADVVLVGATRRGSVTRFLLGTTAQRVLRGASVPVLVLRRPLSPRAVRVLLTTDLSDFSAGIHEAGLDVAESLFDLEDAEVRSLLVLWYGLELPPPLRKDLLEESAKRELDRFLAARRGRARKPSGMVRFGEPSHEIVAESVAANSDLVVVGSHGRTRRERFWLGSVAEATVRNTEGNVLVIPAALHERRSLPTVPVQAPTPAAG